MTLLRNPYLSRGPIRTPEMFFGRTDALREIADFLKGNQSVSVVGPRKIGKTSLLFHLLRPAVQEQYGLGSSRVVAYLDCEVMGDETPAEIFQQLAAEVRAEMESRGAPEEPALEAACNAPSRLSFEGAIRALGKRGLSTVFLLDEFERLSANTKLDINFFNALRSMAGRYPLAFITASAIPLITLTFSGRSQEILSSPFFNIFAPVFLRALPEPEARSLIRIPSEKAGRLFPGVIQDFLYRYSGGHPFFLQVACFHAFEASGEIDEIENRAAQELHPHFEYCWRNLSELQRRLLMEIPAQTSAPTNTVSELQVLRELEQAGLLAQRDRHWKYPSTALRRYLETQTELPVTGNKPAVPASGNMLGPYEILEPIGKGGMAVVYKARHTRLDRPAAVKVLPSHLAMESDFRERFEREARAVATLKHPNIIQVYDCGDTDGTYYMAMEYIAGRDLAFRLSHSGKLPMAQIWWIAADIAAALDFAHAAGIVHRDVKPSNVLLEPLPKSEKGLSKSNQRLQRAILTDFGIAKILSGGQKATQAGMFGTVDYMSPEQIRMESNIDGRADLYAMGILLFEMLTGRLPYTGMSPNEVMIAHLDTPPPDARTIAPELPERAAVALQRAMAKNPKDRFPTAREFLKALK